MAKDKNVTIKFKSDTNNVETGINKIISELNKLSKNKALTSLGRLGSAISGVSTTFSMVSLYHLPKTEGRLGQ
ncbi:MAG: hypothetical protein K5829_01935 [Treponema sp.]|nr:hypothetical protein [Treponema sp.]